MSRNEYTDDGKFPWIDDWAANKAVIQLAQSSDAFGKTVADITQTKADIGAGYSFNPEKLRFYDEGNRVFLQYVSSAKFTDAADVWRLQPNADNVLRLETAEKYRYTVGNVIGVSRAFEANKKVTELQGDDKIVLGYGRPDLENDMANADGWFWEWDSNLTEENQVRLTEYRNGTQVFNKVTKTNKALDAWTRIEDKFNGYNVGIDNRIETYTKLDRDGFVKQVNDNLGGTANVEGKGPKSANKHVTFNVRSDANTTDLELDVGSIAVIAFGNHTPQVRVKAADLGSSYEATTLSYTATDLYEPLFAIRRDPNKDNISTDITSLDLNEFSGGDDAQILGIAVDPNKTDASNWVTPNEHNSDNSAVQITEDVTSYPDINGNIVDGNTNAYVSDPGGYQLGLSNCFVEGRGTNIRRSSTQKVRKRKIQNGDVLIILGISSTTGDFAVTFDTEQDF